MTDSQEQGQRSIKQHHLLRLAVFACACICIIIGLCMLIFSTTSNPTRGELLTAQTVKTEAKADVLLLLSYDDAHPNTSYERTGVLDVMRRSSVDVDVLYMDARNCPVGSAAHTAWEQLFAQKMLQHGQYAAIICADDEALGFVEQNHATLFGNTPVVFFGINDAAHAQAVASSGLMTGIVEDGCCGNTMRLAHQLLPQATSFLAIVDDTATGLGDRAQFKLAMADQPGMDATIVDASLMTRDELGQTIKSAGNDTIVFYLDAANDIAGNAYTIDENSYFISKAANTPVFRGALGGVGEGVVGSGFVDLERDGQRAAELAIMVLNGASPSGIPVENTTAANYVFDGKVMAEYGLKPNILPAEASLINDTRVSFSNLVVPVIFIVLGIILVIICALMGYKRSANDTRAYHEQKKKLERSMYSDYLTNIPNMHWLSMYSSNENSDEIRSILEVDLKNLNEINSSYGREVGDGIIKAIAERLNDVDKEFLVRLSGAQFLLGFKEELTRGSGALSLLEYLLSQPVVVGENAFDLNVHLGVVNREPGMTIEEMVSGVDMTVRESHAVARGCEVIFYDDNIKAAMEDKIEIITRLKHALANDGFTVYYQPQVQLDTNEVIGYEALVRLKDDSFSPAQFIPIAEMNGMVVDIDRVVTQKAIAQLATWKKRNKRLRPVSINYSPVQLKDDGYVDFILQLLQDYGVSPNLIKIEITENLFINDTEKADELFERLTAAGISIELDDFGIGYTSVARVMAVPAQVVKIDKSLVDTYLVEGKEDVIGNLVRMVHGMGKRVIVEGVETHQQIELCQTLDCDMVQGFFFSKPLLPERAAQYKPSSAA